MHHKQNSTIVSRDIAKNISSYLLNLRKTFTRLEEGSLSFHYGGRPVKAKKSDVVRVISSVKADNALDYGIRNIVLESVMTADSLAVGSGYLVLKNLLTPSSEKILFQKKIEIEDIDRVVNNMLGSGVTSDSVKSIVRNASISSEIRVTSSDMAFYPVLSVDHLAEINANLSEMFFTKRKRIENTAIVFIDGIVERLGEIESLLQSFAEEKKNLCIFSRGFSPEVSHTLSENHKRGSLYVFPFRVVGGEDAFSIFENLPGFFSLENILSLRTASAGDFDFIYNVNIKNSSTSIEGLEGTSRRAQITLPSRFRNLSGLIEDRILYGKKLVAQTAFSGIAWTEGRKRECFSLDSIDQSRKTLESLKRSLEGIGAFVLQS